MIIVYIVTGSERTWLNSWIHHRLAMYRYVMTRFYHDEHIPLCHLMSDPVMSQPFSLSNQTKHSARLVLKGQNIYLQCKLDQQKVKEVLEGSSEKNKVTAHNKVQEGVKVSKIMNGSSSLSKMNRKSSRSTYLCQRKRRKGYSHKEPKYNPHKRSQNKPHHIVQFSYVPTVTESKEIQEQLKINSCSMKLQ